MKLFFLFIFTCSLILLHGCISTSIIGTTAIAVKGLYDPRTIGRQIDDVTLTLNVSAIINKYNNKNTNINVTAYKGRVLLTGQSLNFSLINRIEQNIKNIKGIEFLHNEIRLNKPISIKVAMYDSWITAKIKTKIFYYNLTHLLHVKVITENHEVFLVGIVNKKEGNILAKIASETIGVRLVTTMFLYSD